MKEKFPHPQKYWLYMGVVLICAVLLFVNIFRMDEQIGGNAFWDYSKQDWQFFAVFLIEEAVIVGVLFLFSVLAGRLNIKRNGEILSFREKNKFLGLEPSEYDEIWFDFDCTERALIQRQEGKFILRVDEYCDESEAWKCVSEAQSYDDLSALKKALFHEFDFFCDRNAVLDKHGNEVYRDDGQTDGKSE